MAGRPHRLAVNEGIAFQGSTVLGLGFTMTAENAADLIRRDPRNAEVLQPYVNGRDLNQRPDCSASRWIINFRDWSLERAETYPDPMDIVRRLVKPLRDKIPEPSTRERWWLYSRSRPELYEAISSSEHVLAISIVSNPVMPVRMQTRQVFANLCAVFALDDMASLALLSSSVHGQWVLRYASTLETRIRYAPSDLFLTFPWPRLTTQLERLGGQLDDHRRNLMLSRSWGLTTTYNHVHNPTAVDPAVVELREIHEAIDWAMFDAYGWDDIGPQAGHYPTKIGVRWTISPEVRFTVLDRLLELNHLRHEQEQAGLPSRART